MWWTKKRKRFVIALLLVAFAACIACVLQGPAPETYDGVPIPQLIEDWGNGKKGTKPAEEQFGKIGPRATPYVLKALKRRNSLLHSPYAAIYPRLPKPLQKRLSPPCDAVAVRQTAAQVVGSWMHKIVPPEQAIPALLDALDDDDVGVRTDAASGLESSRRHWERDDPNACTVYDNVAVEKLLAVAKKDSDKDVRSNAIGSMGWFRAAATNAFGFWKETATNGQGTSRINAIYNLNKYNQLSPDLIPALNTMYSEGNTWQKELAQTCLQKLQTNQPSSQF